MATSALINVETVVSRYMLKYRLSTDDAFILTEHACDCVSHFNLYDSDFATTAKTSVDANKIIEMPSDMVAFVDLVVPYNGKWWSFTEKREIVNTTTFTGLVEGRDATVGEGVDIDTGRKTGYASRGAINDFNYTIDWKARRIFCTGVQSETVVLIYVTSGIEATGTTQVPIYLIDVIDAYLTWKRSYWDNSIRNERQLLERDYTNARLSARNLVQGMSYNAWRDIILGGTLQAPQR